MFSITSAPHSVAGICSYSGKYRYDSSPENIGKVQNEGFEAVLAIMTLKEILVTTSL